MTQGTSFSDGGTWQVMAWHPHGAFAIAALCFTSHYWAMSLRWLKFPLDDENMMKI